MASGVIGKLFVAANVDFNQKSDSVSNSHSEPHFYGAFLFNPEALWQAIIIHHLIAQANG